MADAVRAVYIRHVSRSPERLRAIEALAREVAEADSRLLLAAECGLISSEACAEVLAERVAQQGEVDLHPTRTVRRPTLEDTRGAVEQGAVHEALAGAPGDASPPNVMVEPDAGKAQRPLDGERA